MFGAKHMRPSLLILFVILCAGCGRHFTLHKTVVLGQSSEGSIIVETWQGDALMEQPVWHIFLRPVGSTNLQALLTVEAEFQESEPGYPHLITTNGLQLVQDKGQSYIFSLASHDFITNRYPANAYAGNLKSNR